MTQLISALKARAKLYSTIRHFFAERGALEVETPILSQAASTDVHLASIVALRRIDGQPVAGFLQTSPEFAMKRLLAAGVGDCYQLCKVFRDDEHGQRHNSEFTMLEWYRVGGRLEALMEETQALLSACFGVPLTAERVAYKEVFYHQTGVNPLTASREQLAAKALELGFSEHLMQGLPRLGLVDLLFSHAVEPKLGARQLTFLCDFPPELASLAKVRKDGDGELVASRFEAYIGGFELANGYDELTDKTEIAERFAADNAERARLGLPVMPKDERLLAVLDSVPPCVGIALGVDRVLMLLQNADEMSKVLAFAADKA